MIASRRPSPCAKCFFGPRYTSLLLSRLVWVQERFSDFLASEGGRLNWRGLLFGEAKVSLAILCPYWATRVSCR